MTNHTYVQAWQDYRRRARGFLYAWLGGFVAIATLTMALLSLGAPEWAPMPLALAWIAAFLHGAVRLQRFRCPRCGKPFFSTTFSYWPFARECRHCGLPKWQA